MGLYMNIPVLKEDKMRLYTGNTSVFGNIREDGQKLYKQIETSEHHAPARIKVDKNDGLKG
jgi:hypothetical protein